MNEELLEQLGQISDAIDNLYHAMLLPGLPDRIHIEGMKASLPGLRDELRDICRKHDYNPWEE